MYNNYPDGMRESDIPGWNDWDTTLDGTCDAPDVTVGLVDIDTFRVYLISIRKILENKFLPSNDENLKKAIDRVNELINLVNNPMKAEVYNCPFEGEVDAVGSGNTLYWNCPICQTEHEQEVPRYDD
jgi:hypothetical protein